MEFKLKESWSDYFTSGFLLGLVVFVIALFYQFKWEMKVEWVLTLIFFSAVSIAAFLMGCKVKK